MDRLRRTALRIDPLLVGIVAIAFVLRVQGIDDEGYWLDEVTSLSDSSRPLLWVLVGKGKPGHPPLYYLLLKGWTALFGTSEPAVRMLSAILGTASVGAAYALFRALHGRAAGLGASLLLALSFHHIVFSQEARNYALFGLLVLLSTHALWRALDKGGIGRWATYAVCALFMAHTHLQAYVVLLGMFAGTLLAARGRGMRKGALRDLALADLIVLAAAMPSIALHVLGFGPDGAMRPYGYWQQHVTLRDVVDLGVLWTPGGPLFAPGSSLYGPGAPQIPWRPWLPVTLVLPAACLAFAAARAKAPSPRPPPVPFHAGMLYAGVGAFVLVALLKPIWYARYLFALLPFHLGALAAPLAVLRPRVRLAVLLALVALSIPGLVTEKRTAGRTPWRETAAYVAGRNADAVLLVARPYLDRPFRWYYERPFTVVRDAKALVVAAPRSAEGGRRVLVVYEGVGSDAAVEELARTLERRGGARFGQLRVHEFAGKR